MFRPSLRASTSDENDFALDLAEGKPIKNDAMLQLDSYTADEPIKSPTSTDDSPPESPKSDETVSSPFKRFDPNNNLFS